MPAWLYRSLIAIGLLLLLALQYRMWVGEGSLAHQHALKKEIARIEAENALLRERNRKLEARIIDLKKGQEAIEATARYELGLIGEDETFFRLPDESAVLATPGYRPPVDGVEDD